MKRYAPAFFVAAALLLISCASRGTVMTDRDADFFIDDVEALRYNGPTFADGTSTDALERYFAFYGYEGQDQLRAGYVEVRGTRFFVVHGEGKDRANDGAYVVVVHGYLEHSGRNTRYLNDLLAAGHNYLAVDLRGHGLSAGPLGDIDEFKTYVDDLVAIMNEVGTILGDPGFSDGNQVMVGHSTGGAVIMDYALSRDVAAIGLVAPLVRNHLWHLSRFGYAISGWFLSAIPPRGSTSRNEEYRHFADYVDPIRPDSVPTGWVGALGRWERNFGDDGPRRDIEVVIVQGTRDSVVDWRHNHRVIKNTFPSTTVTLIDGAHHTLFNEPTGDYQATWEALLGLYE